MKLEEFYAALGGDFEDTLARMCNKRLVERFVLRFLSDETFSSLEKAMSEKDYKEAFRTAHCLKGTASNLGFTKLYSVADVLTDTLRDGKKPEDDALLLSVKEEYERTMTLLRKFQGADSLTL